MNRTAIRIAPVVAAVGLTGGVLWGLATGFGLRQGSACACEWLDYLSLHAMVADSDAVVVADLLFVETVGEQRELPDGEVLRIDHRLAAWSPSTWLIGTPSAGEVFYVETGDVPLNIGATHVLFLRARENTDGLAQWAIPGEPFFALVEPGGELRFIASERYREQQTEAGRTFPVEGSDAPFEANLEDVGRVVAGLTATPIPTVDFACGPQPPKDSFNLTFVGGAMRLTWSDCWADEEDGLVVVVSYPGPNSTGSPSEEFEYRLAAGVTEFEVPEEASPYGSGHPDCIARNDVDVDLFVVRGGERSIVSGAALVGLCR